MVDDNLPVPGGSDNLPAVQTPAQAPQVTQADLNSGGWVHVGQAKPQRPTLSAENRETVNALSKSLRATLNKSVPAPVLKGVEQWLTQAFTEPLTRERPKHHYKVDTYGIPPDNGPYIVSFLNFAQRSGFTQSHVQLIISWYKSLFAPQKDNEEATDSRDIARAELALKDEWGSMYFQNLEVIKRHVRNLPLEERESLHERRPNGTVKLNDPAVLRRLFNQARDGKGNGLQKEIAALESRMRTDRKNWIKDEAAQARLRELYRLRDGE